MERLNHELPDSTTIRELCEEYKRNNVITKEEYEHNRVKRGLRNADGTGVMAGLTHVCNVHGYLIADGDKIPDKGELTYRGINIEDIVRGCDAEDRFGFEEVAWLLIFGHLPTRSQYEGFSRLLFENRELPEYFPEDMIIKAPSKNIMNKLARSVLALYSYDDSPDDLSLENNMRQSISLIARMPSIMSYAYQVKRRHFDRESMFFHPYEPDHATAEAILNALRPDRKFTHQEAKLLDLLMVLHAEHGGANHQVRMMMDDLMAHVERWDDEDEVEAYLEKILRGEAADGSGLIYGMGHAIYTLSDPRAVILKERAQCLAEEKGFGEKLRLYETVERLSPAAFRKVTGKDKVISANVDFYSGLVYEMLGIPEDLFTPMFAVSRIAGWCAHRIEELTTGGRIMRPAYRALPVDQKYVPLDER